MKQERRLFRFPHAAAPASSIWRARIPGLSSTCLYAHELKVRVARGVPHSLLTAVRSLLACFQGWKIANVKGRCDRRGHKHEPEYRHESLLYS
jgi:hypothetical protein